MNNELLNFVAKVLVIGIAGYLLSAIIFYFVASTHVRYPKQTFHYWLLVPWTIAGRIVSGSTIAYFADISYMISLLCSLFFMLPFLYFSARLSKKLPSDTIQENL